MISQDKLASRLNFEGFCTSKFTYFGNLEKETLVLNPILDIRISLYSFSSVCNAPEIPPGFIGPIHLESTFKRTGVLTESVETLISETLWRHFKQLKETNKETKFKPTPALSRFLQLFLAAHRKNTS